MCVLHTTNVDCLQLKKNEPCNRASFDNMHVIIPYITLSHDVSYALNREGRSSANGSSSSVFLNSELNINNIMRVRVLKLKQTPKNISKKHREYECKVFSSSYPYEPVWFFFSICLSVWVTIIHTMYMGNNRALLYQVRCRRSWRLYMRFFYMKYYREKCYTY